MFRKGELGIRVPSGLRMNEDLGIHAMTISAR